MSDPYYPRTPGEYERTGNHGVDGIVGIGIGGAGPPPNHPPPPPGGNFNSTPNNPATLSSSTNKVYSNRINNDINLNMNDVVGHNTTSFSNVPLGGGSDVGVITEQPLQTSFGSQISGNGGGSNAFGRSSHLPQLISPGMLTGTGIPLPGFEILDRMPSFKIHNTDITEGYSTCRPSYKIFNASGQLVLKGTSDTLFCPFDSKQKSVYVKDSNEDCIFHVKFTPSICECDSEEKRCFAVFSPVFENPFGAILFEAGQLKYSLKILNALEAETFAVQFIGSSDITIKGADGSVVAIINIHRERCRCPKFSLTLMEEVSSANKALFIGCVITLDLVMCEAVCTRCICFAPVALACLMILGLTVGSYASGGSKSSI